MGGKQYFLFGLIFTIQIVCLTNSFVKAAEYSKEETKLINQFRNLMKHELYQDFMKTDNYLITWLRARKMNLQDAQQMLQKSLNWRKENNIDNILKEDFSPFQHAFKLHSKGHDKYGHPLFFVDFGTWDIRKAVVGGHEAKLQRYLCQLLEIVSEKVRTVNAESEAKNITQMVMLFDGSGYNVRQHACIRCIPQYGYFINNLESNYPTMVHKIFFINYPEIFQHLLRIILPFFHEHTRSAVKVYGFDKEKWSVDLNNLVSRDQIPVKLGGTLVL